MSRSRPLFPSTVRRVALNTAPAVNRRIARRTETNVAYHASHPQRIDQRLAELDREWDIERLLEANAATVAFTGVALAAFVGRRWLALPAVVSAFTRHLRSRRDVIRMLATGRRLLAEIRDPFRLERIRAPLLLVWGDRDRMVFTTGAERVLRAVGEARVSAIVVAMVSPVDVGTLSVAEYVAGESAPWDT